MIYNLQNFLSFGFTESKNIFQKNFPEKFFKEIFQQNFPERFYNNFVAFQESINNIIGGGSREEAQEDERVSNSYYPSA